MRMHVGHLALRVEDADAYAAFTVKALGLRETAQTESVIMLSASEKHHELELIRGDHTGVDHIGLEVESLNDLESVRSAVELAGISCQTVTKPFGQGFAEALQFSGPGGLKYEVYTGMERETASITRFTQRPIRRFGHLTFASSDHVAIEGFWREVLGFRVSDRLGRVAWMRCDADHHGLAITPGPEGTSLHHHAWQTQDLGTLGSFCDSLMAHQLCLRWGPVRHGPGFNLATYLPDPVGGLIEVYADMIQIVDDAGYVPSDWTDQPNALNMWGPEMPADLLQFGLQVLEPAVPSTAAIG